AQAIYRQKLTTFEREEGLYNNKAVMKKDYLLAQAETNKQQKHVNTLRQRLIFLGMTNEMLDDVLASEKISGTISLRAPIDGIVTHRDVDPGEIVDRDKQAFTITDLRTVSVIADIPEVELRRLKLGAKAVVKAASFPYDKFEGTISYISSTINPELRTVPIRVRLVNPKLKLKSNMFAEIDLLQQPTPVLVCPKAAVQEHDGSKFVYLQCPEGYREQKIETGNTNEKYTEVISGLKEGDKVVTSGSLLLKTEFTQVH
ncbi:MAG: efflux RND transporter periplasmic adaptor subunit, partial [Candidatus Obscuribacterales bacterium]|nr:efflux RND transporter periplasmic adaptor subunit [Candidatus Obscuribacterales bacterium]